MSLGSVDSIGAGIGIHALLSGNVPIGRMVWYWCAYQILSQLSYYFGVVTSMFTAWLYPRIIQTFEIISPGTGGNKTSEIGSVLIFFARTNPHSFDKEYIPDSIDDDISFNIATGTYTVMYNGRWVRLSYYKNQGSMMAPNVVSLKVWTISTNRSFFDGLIAQSTKAIQATRSIYTYGGGDSMVYRSDSQVAYWKRHGPIQSRRWSNTIISSEHYKLLSEAFARYQVRSQKEIDMEIPHKLCIVLSGPPGFGKTTLIKAIAHEYKLNLYIGSLSSMTDKALPHISKTLRPDSVLVFEDVDCMVSRKKPEPDAAKSPDPWMQGGAKVGVTLSAMLNMLDGLTTIGNIVIMTTNYPEKLDEALLRSERVNLHLRLGPDPEVYAQMYTRFYPEACKMVLKDDPTGVAISNSAVSREQIDIFASECTERKLSVADLQAHFRANINDPIKALMIQ
jgi:ATPase family associated with various cellular activities (AAA)